MPADDVPDDGADDKKNASPGDEHADDVSHFRAPEVWDDHAQETVTYTYTYSYNPSPVRFEFEHLVDERLFCVTETNSAAEPQYFRDRPTRHLVVEPDRDTGEFTPVVKQGRPVYLWLCREEREGP
jgi:hypothetical protein